MKKILLSLMLVLTVAVAKAQVPNFAGTAGKGHLYGYTSLKFRPGTNKQQTYSCLEYGFTDWFVSGADLATDPNGSANIGYIARFGKLQLCDYLKIGAQTGPSFDLNDNMKFNYLTTALYLNGNITKDGKLFYVADTWWTLDKDGNSAIDQWVYLAYTFGLKSGDSITPMVGTIYDWKFENDADLAAGFYYSHKNFNFYLWGNDFLKDNPRVVVGFEFNL